jgi:mannose-1-phosphate guanylyltransferase/phosphomannomutase
VKAVIMAGGEGTRLRPLTSNCPKPLLPIANRPMMEHVIDLLKRHGVTDIVVTVAFLANQIKDYFGDGQEFGVTIRYVDEPTPLGTAGSVRNAADLLSDERFLVISGDVITDIDLTKIVDFHIGRKAVATIGLTPVENPLEFGIVITREDGTIERFLEKPTWGQVFSDTINTGIYVLEPEIFEFIDAGRPVDFSGEVFPRLLQDGRPLYGAVAGGYWEDVGTLEAYLGAHKDVLDQMVALDIPGFEVGNAVWIGESTETSPEAVIEGPAVIGPECTIEAGCRLGPYTVLGSHVRLLANTTLERCVLHDNVYVAAGGRLRGTVIGRATSLRANVVCEEGVVLGDEVQVGEGARLGDNVKVYPAKIIDDGAIVNASIVWESRGASSLFGREGVSGLANVDITPELAAKVALAYGSSLRKGATVVTSRDTSRAARMLKRAMMAGLNAAGVNVLVHGGDPVPRRLAAGGRWPVRAPPPGRPADDRRALPRHVRHRHHGRRPAEAGAHVPARGLPPRASGGDRRHHLPDPHAGRVRHRDRADRRAGGDPRPAVQAGHRLRPRACVARDVERDGEARIGRPGREPLLVHDGAARLRRLRVRWPGGGPRAGVRRARRRRPRPRR